MTRLRVLAPFLCLAALHLSAQTAKTQVSVYGTVALTNFGFYDNGSSGVSFKGDTGGIGGGMFLNFPIQSRLSAGVDARALYSPGSKGGTSAAALLRIGFVPRRVRLRPYFEIGGGVVSSTDYSLFTDRVTNGAAEFLGGLDIRLNDSVDLRAVEYGAAAAGSTSETRSGFGFLDTGVVYHFHHAGRAHTH